MPELKRLNNTSADPYSIFTVSELPSTSYDDAAIKRIWQSRFVTSIRDWQNTLEWASPDFNPPGADTLQKTIANNEWNSIAMPFNSNDSVFGKRMQPKIDEVDTTYNRNDGVINDDYGELRNLWSGITHISRDLDGATPSMVAPIVKPSEGSQNWYSSNENFIETYEQTGTESGKNVFVSEEKNSTYSHGMSDIAVSASNNNFSIPNPTEYSFMDMIDASVFGGEANFEFGGTTNPHGDPKPDPE